MLHLMVACTIAGCAGSGDYIWYSRLPRETSLTANEYIIGVGDVISIHVLGREEMSLRQKVRSDGRVALLLIGDVEAQGKRPSALKAELEGRLKDYIVSPSVVVNVDEAQPVNVILLGEVSKPGIYPIDQDVRLVHLIALAGGLTDYASRSSIYVIRSTPKPIRIRFTYESIFKNIGGAGDFPLHRDDLVEVE
jgi:polysaccharide export outer membrane protein